MKLKAITGIMLTLLIVNMLAMSFIVTSTAADTDVVGVPDDYPTTQEVDGGHLTDRVTSKNSSWFDDSKNQSFNRDALTEDDVRPCSATGDKWNFNEANEWMDFAYGDDNSVELVVGINNVQPNSYAKLEELTTRSGGKIVNTVSIGGEIKAAVADIPLAAVSNFGAEVQATGLSRYMEPNLKFEATFVPNDPYWMWQWGPKKIEADYAWNTTIGDPSVLVAVIDTGIDWNHPDLVANYVALGYDWVNKDEDPMDDHGHGTHCAGIIAAELNNGIGIAGLAQVRIMAEKGLDWGGWGTEDDLANAIIHAVDTGADILSNSWGGYEESMLIHEAVEYAYDHGVLVIAAAGNEATSLKLYPAAYDEVVAVTATDEFDYPAGWTNFGEWVELAAPGVNIYSTVWNDYYTYMSGTSMACPHVAGVAALIWSQFPNMTRDWVRLQLRFTADDLGDPGFDDFYGYGRINARRAVEQVPPDHEVLILNWERPPYVEPGGFASINTTVFNFGTNHESNITVQLIANGSIVDSMLISFLASSASTTVSCSWNPIVEGIYNVTSYVVPVPNETLTENNVVWAYVYVGFPLKAFVLDSAGTDIDTSAWEVLNTNWPIYGSTMIYIDYTTLNIDDITYNDLVASDADVLIISCAFAYDWEFTDSEIDAISQYVLEGHGLIATAGTLYYEVPNNNKLAPLFGLSETTTWYATLTDLLHMENKTHPLFVNIPDPFVFKEVETVVPSDYRWDSNELFGGTYVALGHFEESAIVVNRGLVYISPWLEIIPPYYHFHLQLLYNAITWSKYQKPEHELLVCLNCPPHLEPGESTMLNATVYNMGLNNETDVELYLMIDGSVVNSTTISELLTGSFYKIDYLWAPTVEGAYNVTAYAPSVPGEEFILNNVYSVRVFVRFAKFVLWDDVHDGDGDSLTENYLELYRLLTASGFIVDELTSGTINIGLLAYYDILVVIDPEIDFLSSEITDIHNWVTAGGAMFVIVDSGYPLTIDKLMAPYGVQTTGSASWYTGTTTNIASHPVTQDVSSIYYDLAWEIAVTSPSETLAWTVEFYSMLSATTGGEVVVITDSNIMDNWGLRMADNTQLMLNIFNWIGVEYEHELKVTLEAPTFVEPGNLSLLNATVHNRGLNNETNVELQLLINGTTVSSTTIPELPTGASYTINYSWTPTVKATYNVTAYAPPVHGENVTMNNRATKLVTVTYPLIRPIEGQWANYTLYYFEYNRSIGVGESNFTYDHILSYLVNRLIVVEELSFTYDRYISPYLINITLWSKDPMYGYIKVGWMVVNIMNRWVEMDSGIYWAGMWYPGWIETNITLGSTVNLLDGIATVVGSRIIQVGVYLIDCWELLLESYGIEYTFWYDKASGLWVGMEYAMAPYRVELMLVATNIPIGVRYDHEIAVTLEAPTSLAPNESSLLNATVYNIGLNNETDVELQLLIDGTVVNSTTIPKLVNGTSYTIDYFWTPTVEATYNVTAYAPPVSGENFTANNVATKMVDVRPVKGYVLFDQTHGTDSITNYRIWVANLTDRGYVVETLTISPITPSLLEGYGVFVIPQAYGYYSSGELSAIQDFVLNGGGLLVIGDDNPWIYTDLTSFAGITWTGGGVSGITYDITPHDVTVGVTSVYLDSPIAEMLVTAPAQDLVRDPAGGLMLAVSEQVGRVIGFADDGSLWDYGIVQEDNLRLANNMIDWLLGIQYGHELTVTLEAPAFLELGQLSLLNATVENLGLNNETNVDLFLLINGTIVDNVTIPELPSGTSYTIDYLWTPTLEATYNVTAYAPPVPYENVTTNNFMSKMVTVARMSILSVEPSTITAEVGEAFTINITVTDVTDLFGFDFTLRYDTAVLTATSVTIGSFLLPDYIEWINEINDAVGYVWYAVTQDLYEEGVSGNGTLATISFTIDSYGESCLYLCDTKLSDSEGHPIAHKVYDGYFTNVPRVYVDPPNSTAAPGETFTVDIAITNVFNLYFWEFWMSFDPNILECTEVLEGPFLKAVDATSWSMMPPKIDNYAGTVKASDLLWYYPAEGATGSGILCNITFQVKKVGKTTLDFYYTMLCTFDGAKLLPIEHVAEDGFFTTVTVLGHDVAVTSVMSSHTAVTAGTPVTICVTVANEGDFSETFDVTVYYDSIPIDTQTVVLGVGATTTLEFTWDTGVAEGDYTIIAEAILAEDHDPTDNTYVDGIVTVTPPLHCVIFIDPTSGPVGTMVSVNGAGFSTSDQVLVTFDDMLLGYAITDNFGNFTFIFNIPVSAAGNHTVKAFDAETNYASTTFKVIDATPLDIEIDVGAIHFKGELAEFYAQITFKGVAVNATSINAMLYKPDGTTEALTAQCIATGFYKIPYSIPGNAPTGTYALVIKASYTTSTIEANGTSFKSFLLSPTLTAEGALIQDIKEEIATIIIPNLGAIKANLTAINATLVRVQGTVGIVRSTIGEFTVPGATICATVTAINGTVVTINSTLGSIQQDITAINVTIVDLQKKIDGYYLALNTTIGDIELKLDETAIPLLQTINATIEDIQGGLVTINTTLGEVQVDLGDISLKLVRIQGDIERGVATISGAITDTEGNILVELGQVEVNLDAINATLTSIDGRLVTIETHIGAINGTITSIQGDIATIETYVGTIKAMLEGWTGGTTSPITTPQGTFQILVLTTSTLEGPLGFSDNVLTINLSGPSGTAGTTNVVIPNRLLIGIESSIDDVVVTIDDERFVFTYIEQPEAYVLQITYTHSAHMIKVYLAGLPPPPFPWALFIAILAVAVIAAASVAVYILKIRKSQAASGSKSTATTSPQTLRP